MNSIKYLTFLNFLLFVNSDPLDTINVNFNLEGETKDEGEKYEDYQFSRKHCRFSDFQNWRSFINCLVDRLTSRTYTPSPRSTPIPTPTPTPIPTTIPISTYQPSVTSSTSTPSPRSAPIPTQPPVTSPTSTPSARSAPIPTQPPGFAENVESLSSAKIASLRKAMRRLHASPDWARVTSQHGLPLREECNQTICCIHGGYDGNSGFLSWHRAFLDSFNNALGIALPYWDWTTSCFPSIARSAPFSSGLQTFEGFNNYTNRTSECLPIESHLNKTMLALQQDDYQQFSNTLEDVHDDVHINIGGTMEILELAAYDPIFFFHHSFVDLVYAVYNVLKPNILPPNLGQRLIPFGRTINQTLSTNRFNLDINSDRIVFGGMTLAQIQNRISRRTQESGVDDEDRIYAGFFKRSYSTSGIIKFNLCNKDDCSYPGGEVSILGGTPQKPYVNPDPTKVDITEAVNKAGIDNIKQLKFKITSFTKVNGRPINKTIYTPIRIVRPGNNGRNPYNSGKNDGYCIFFNRNNIQPPKLRIPKNTLLEVDSPYQNIIETKNKNSYIDCNKRDGIAKPSKRPLRVRPGITYLFDDNCKPQRGYSDPENVGRNGNGNVGINGNEDVGIIRSKLQIVKD